jgi:hypothetical protein
MFIDPPSGEMVVRASLVFLRRGAGDRITEVADRPNTADGWLGFAWRCDAGGRGFWHSHGRTKDSSGSSVSTRRTSRSRSSLTIAIEYRHRTGINPGPPTALRAILVFG